MSPRARALAPWLLAGALAALAWALPPIAQPPAYYDFADQRACWGLPNCVNTASNAFFVLAGGIGLRFMQAGQGAWRDRREAWPYRLFFFGAILVGLGSGYYHLDPGNERLLWDRLAMMLTFMAWVAAVVAERVGPAAGLRLLPLLLAAGLGAAAWWGWGEAGDLLPYLLVQLFAVLLVPLLLWLYPPRYSGGRAILAVIGLYLLALLFDLGDRLVFALSGGLTGGHAIKHALAALAVYSVVRHLRRRRFADGAIKQA
jgi:hypothetical protein